MPVSLADILRGLHHEYQRVCRLILDEVSAEHTWKTV